MTLARPYVSRQGDLRQRGAQFPNTRKRRLQIWWREIDRVLLSLVLLLMAIGSVAVAASSPASARRLSGAAGTLPDLYFFWLHLRFQLLGLMVLFVTSLMPREWVRRGGILLAAAMFLALCLVPIIGTEVNGARRWINIGMSFQPSEFLKPAFAVLCAWILSWRVRDPELPVIPISVALLAAIITLLMMQPNLGEAILFAGVWFVLAMLAGLPLQRIAILVGGGTACIALAYMFYDNARHRIDSFLGGGTAFDQVDLASRTLLAGGWTGSGLWLGTQKMRLPEAHTDYIFSVIGEEFGLLVCGLIVVLYLAIVLRIFVRLLSEDNLFIILSAAGLTALFGGQAFINIMVNLQLFPSKGTTLPLISYGGSSTIAQCFAIGLLLAITRRNPYLQREKFDLRNALEKEAGQ
ncbi:cell division protein FtsW [Altererythrobacter atlanticus]|uniref:Probable peptidoglycan glycosyltransferase FtsW n=1 Tax=Croceibacterium atlanticum TaxID=1267766 RepID=A0A0F7KTD0_9SPHN|nr:putative peptidoglycan glycosyltransferase FtsW [Croceibacterium atlanticum]AKH42386.1 Lipid II flippase FtsW [Croceibacterium atlanticum]MBB5731163.1 cell division protein FtsW [Croceibacterium atlanticum]